MSKTEHKCRNSQGQVQQITGETVEIAFVDQGYTGDLQPSYAAAKGIQLEVVKLPEASIRIRFATASVGGGAKFCLGWAVQTVSEGL